MQLCPWPRNWRRWSFLSTKMLQNRRYWHGLPTSCQNYKVWWSRKESGSLQRISNYQRLAPLKYSSKLRVLRKWIQWRITTSYGVCQRNWTSRLNHLAELRTIRSISSQAPHEIAIRRHWVFAWKLNSTSGYQAIKYSDHTCWRTLHNRF